MIGTYGGPFYKKIIVDSTELAKPEYITILICPLKYGQVKPQPLKHP